MHFIQWLYFTDSLLSFYYSRTVELLRAGLKLYTRLDLGLCSQLMAWTVVWQGLSLPKSNILQHWTKRTVNWVWVELFIPWCKESYILPVEGAIAFRIVSKAEKISGQSAKLSFAPETEGCSYWEFPKESLPQ